MADKRCKEEGHQTLSKTGEGKEAAKAAFDKAYPQTTIDGLKKDAEHDLKCAERQCYPDDDDRPKHCEFYWNPSEGTYVNEPDTDGGKTMVAYVFRHPERLFEASGLFFRM